MRIQYCGLGVHQEYVIFTSVIADTIGMSSMKVEDANIDVIGAYVMLLQPKEEDPGQQPDHMVRKYFDDKTVDPETITGQNPIRVRTLQDKIRCCGLHRWLIFISAFVVMLITGYIFSFGRLFVFIINTFNTTRAQASTIQSSLIGISFGAGIVNGAVVYSLGPRRAGLIGSFLLAVGTITSYFAISTAVLVFTTGIVSAWGLSLLMVSSYTVVGNIFDGKTKSAALAALSTGPGFGGLIYPYVLGYLLETNGLYGCFLIVGGIFLNAFAAVMLWDTSTNEKKRKRNDENVLETECDAYREKETMNCDNICTPMAKTEEITADHQPNSMCSTKQRKTLESIKYLFKNLSFIFFAVGLALVNSSMSLFLVFVADLFNNRGFGDDKVSFGLLMLSIFNIIGRILQGFLVQLSSISIFSVPIFATVLGLACIVSSIFVKTFELNIVVCCALGISTGVLLSSTSVTTAQLVKSEHFPTAVGVAFGIESTGVAFGPLFGLIRDKTGSYTYSLAAVAIVIVIGLFLMACAQKLRHRSKQRKKSDIACFGAEIIN